jgi:general secretion pathway protein D
MRRIKLNKLASYWILLLTVVFAAGCAGPKATDKAKNAKVESHEIPKIPSASDSTPSRDEKSRIAQQVADTARPAPAQMPSVLPTPGIGVESLRVSKPEPAPATSRAAETPKKKDAPEGTGPKIVLNFDNADLYAVIGTIAELLGINYIVDPNVTGKVTINTAGGLYKKDLFPVFLQILEVNGLTAIKEGSLYRIVQLKDSPRMPIDSRIAHGDEDIPPMDKIVIQIIPLKFISTQEMTKLITPFISAGGTIVSDTGSNTLLVVDKGINILKILRLVETFDVNMLEKVYYRFYPLKYLDAEEVTKTLSDFTSSYEKISNVFVRFIAISRINTLFVVSTTPLVFEKIEEILRQIDKVDEEVAPQVYVYFVKNGEAKDLATLLDQVFKKKSTSKEKKDSKKKAGGVAAISRNPFSKDRMEEKKKEEKAAEKSKTDKTEVKAEKISTAAKEETAGTLMSEVNITPDEIRNALIIEATPPDYRIIENILRQLDVMPRQVLIEATIAEITVNTSTEFGMEWALGKGAAAAGSGSFAATINKLAGADAISTGLRYSIGVTDKWYAALHAMATEGKVNILSSPHVLASDNKEAKIDVSREIPIASGSTQVATAAVISETTIEYRDTGVILSVTPHINERGLVTMDISQEVSDLEKKAINVAGKDYPAFFKRTVSTTLTVRHGQTIAIGGLIKDKEDESITGVPCLIKIPVLRYLFGTWGKEVEKIELIVLITPRVVANLDDVDAVTEEFKQKVRNVMNRFFPK